MSHTQSGSKLTNPKLLSIWNCNGVNLVLWSFSSKLGNLNSVIKFDAFHDEYLPCVDVKTLFKGNKRKSSKLLVSFKTFQQVTWLSSSIARLLKNC